MDEAAMLEGLCKRDSNAQKLFWDKYWPRVYAICARILGRGTDATDLAVDLLTEFIDIRVQKVENPAAMCGYIRLMAVRRALDFRKKRNRFSSMDYETGDKSSLSPEEEAMLNSMMPRLKHCMNKLTEKARKAVLLKYTEQWSNERIGDILGGSRQYIGRLLKQSEELLRKCVEKSTGESKEKSIDGVSVPAKTALCPLDMALLLSHAGIERTDVHWEYLYKIALVKNGAENSAITDEVALHLDVCEECREAVAFLDSMNDEAVATGTDVKSRKRKLRKRPYTIISLAAIIVTAIAVALWWHSYSTAIEPSVTQLTPKGPQDSISVVIRRDDRLLEATHADTLRNGDQLGFFYSTQTPAYFALVTRDSDGEAVVHYPANGKQSALVQPGENVPLPDGATVEEPGPCEWVVGVFSKKPLELKSLVEHVKRAKVSGASCDLKLKIKDTRTQVVYTFRGGK